LYGTWLSVRTLHRQGVGSGSGRAHQ
jgi:hypothetical protein